MIYVLRDSFGGNFYQILEIEFSEVLIVVLLKDYQVDVDKPYSLEFALTADSVNSLQTRHDSSFQYYKNTNKR